MKLIAVGSAAIQHVEPLLQTLFSILVITYGVVALCVG
jgi:hypothetical protein